MSDHRWCLGPRGLCIVAALAGAGCSGDDLMRQPISGFVTLDGQPLESGAIAFYQLLKKELAPAVVAGAKIEHGYFWIPRGKGLVPGIYDIEIDSTDFDNPPRGDTAKPPPAEAKQRAPAKYNSNTRLAIEIKEAAIKEMTVHLQSD